IAEDKLKGAHEDAVYTASDAVGSLLVPVSDAAFGQVVWRKFERDTVASKHTDAITAQFARQVRQHGPLLVELDAKQAAGEFLDYRSCNFDAIFFTHCPRVLEICTAIP